MRGQSQVALLRAQIATEAEAACRGMYGLSEGVSKHQFITARMERMGNLHKELECLVGSVIATQYLIDVMDQNTL